MFLPTTKKEATALGWKELDVILVTGDAYIDSPFVGVAVIGKILVDAGYRVGVIPQPNIKLKRDITRLGEPALFWGVTAGCIDSMVANRTATGKKRKKDDYTPGGVNDSRPDRASIVYANLIRQHFKYTRPIVLGGIEASLRRITHYDFWTDRIRRSILFDAKADYLLYGMADRSVVELAACLKNNDDPQHIRGLCWIAGEMPKDCIDVPSFEETARNKDSYTRMFQTFYRNNDPVTAVRLAQKQDTRWLVQNRPAPHLSTEELDAVHGLDYEREPHPSHKKRGPVKALETIRFSISTHRGCYGECSFCAIGVHQGRTVRWRSEESILAEARAIAAHPLFKGTIADVGGPTANMYGFECGSKITKGCCPDRRCLFPKTCSGLQVNHDRQTSLLRELRKVGGVKKVVVASGIRYDLVLADRRHGPGYLQEVIRHHVSGQMKVAPEHSETRVLELMGKPGPAALVRFKKMFDRLTKQEGLEQYLTFYMIAAHPGCTEEDMKNLASFCTSELKLRPEQVQIFTPTPSTYATLMYWTEKDPFTGQDVFVEKTIKGRQKQKNILQKR
ncbi:YgiQ family radical SAM protein [Planctomycetota bacterium]